MDAHQAFLLISHALDVGRVAGGYLICGDLKEQGESLVMKILNHLYPETPDQVANQTHPDIAFLEPEGKSRTIHIKSMREKIIEPMAVTSFSGGWKVGVVMGADRMETAAANAFLKTLEEPPPKTLLLLLTDNPDIILPTIISRTQRVDLPLSEGVLADVSAIRAIFSQTYEDLRAKMNAGSQLAELLTNLKDEAADEEVAHVKKAFFKTILHFVRQWMIAEKVPRYLAFRNIEAVEEAFRQSERFLPDEMVLCNLMDKLTFPS